VTDFLTFSNLSLIAKTYNTAGTFQFSSILQATRDVKRFFPNSELFTPNFFALATAGSTAGTPAQINRGRNRKTGPSVVIDKIDRDLLSLFGQGFIDQISYSIDIKYVIGFL
jgi:hypothetical protein